MEKSGGSEQEPGIHCLRMRQIFLEFQASATFLVDGRVIFASSSTVYYGKTLGLAIDLNGLAVSSD